MQWKDIKGYEGYYEVSDSGLVRSLDREVPDKTYGVKKLHGRMKKLTPAYDRGNPNGYFVVTLRKEHTVKTKAVHRLVAEAFLSNDGNLPTVNHKDGNKQNNSISNLEWASFSDNNTHALRTGLRKPRKNTVVQFDTKGNVINVYPSASMASRDTGIGLGMISHCINHRARLAGGYVWKKIGECNDYL